MRCSTMIIIFHMQEVLKSSRYSGPVFSIFNSYICFIYLTYVNPIRYVGSYLRHIVLIRYGFITLRIKKIWNNWNNEAIAFLSRLKHAHLIYIKPGFTWIFLLELVFNKKKNNNGLRRGLLRVQYLTSIRVNLWYPGTNFF